MAYKEKGVVFLGAFYMSKRKDIKEFGEKYHLTFPVGKAKGVAREFRVETIPETVFISRKGEVVKRIKGTFSSQELTTAIEKILK